jgi:hypothetical protein
MTDQSTYRDLYERERAALQEHGLARYLTIAAELLREEAARAAEQYPAPPRVSETVMRSVLADAAIWADPASGSASQEYWRGMRDTLRVLLGITTERPTVTGPGTDVAAYLLLQSKD